MNTLELSFDHIFNNTARIISLYLVSLLHSSNNYNDYYWKDNCFFAQDYNRADAVICFDLANHIIAGGIRYSQSIRMNWYPSFHADELFPLHRNSIEYQAKQKVLNQMQISFVKKKKFFGSNKVYSVPVLTTAFLGDKSSIYSLDTVCDFERNGGCALDFFEMSEDKLIKKYCEEFSISEEEYMLSKDIYNSKTSFSPFLDITENELLARYNNLNGFLSSLNKFGVFIRKEE